MTSRFDPRQELIVISARLVGPASALRVSLALDTGASYTLVQPDTLRLIGYQPTSSTRVIRIVTGSRVESVPVVVVDTLSALGRRRRQMQSWHTGCRWNLPWTVYSDLTSCAVVASQSTSVQERCTWCGIDGVRSTYEAKRDR